MKALFLLSEVETHYISQIPFIEALKRLGIDIDLKFWTFEKIEQERTFQGQGIYDCYISDFRTQKYDIDFVAGRDVSVLHGITPCKMIEYYPLVDDKMGLWIVPTQIWKDNYIKTSGNDIFVNKMISSNGWSKFDLLFTLSQDATRVKEDIYKRYKFDPDKPLIVYAPTGIRHATVTKEQWQQQYSSMNMYFTHGSYYLKDYVTQAVKDLGLNFYEIPHPCVGRDDVIQDRIAMLVASDILISDNSSMALEYTCLDKPVIILQKDLKDRDPRDFRLFNRIENPIFDLGDMVTKEILADVIAWRLQEDDYKEVRKFWREKLGGLNDGKCGERQAQIVYDWLVSLQ